MRRCARDWQRTRHRHRRPLPRPPPHHPASPCKSWRLTGSRSPGPTQTPSALRTNQRNPETAAPLANHCALSEGRTAKPNLEVRGWRFGSIREASMQGNSFPHSGEPDAVAKNRTFPQSQQNKAKKGTYETWSKRIYMCKYIIYVNRQMNIFHLTDFVTDLLMTLQPWNYYLDCKK